MRPSIVNPQVPKICPGYHVKFPPVPCYPFDWMRDNMPAGTITDIDGFAIDFKKEMVTGLMQKREYAIKDYDSVLKGNEVKDSIFQVEEEKEWELRYIISKILDTPLYLALWPTDYPMKKTNGISKPVVVYNIGIKNSDLDFRIEFIGDTNELAEFIRKLRRRSFNRVKTLKVATTKMECYLAAKTGDPWPGNLDTAIWNKEKQIVTAIIEFKTHNYPQYPISTQYFGQWPGDERRYRAFDLMQKHFEAKSAKPKFLYVIWGTDNVHKKVKLQTIENLKVSHSKYINRPIFTDATTKDFTQEVLDYISI